MNHRLKRIIIPIVSFVTLVALACTCSGSGVGLTPTATPAPPPTKAAPPTKPPVEVPTQSSVATKPPIGGGTEVTNTGGGIEVSQDLYSHPSGAFATAYPVGWEQNERDDGVYFPDPNGQASIDVSFTNVGTQLDEAAFNKYVTYIEANWFGGFDDYQATEPEKQQDGSVLVSKTLTDSNGNANTVWSYYTQVGTVIYEHDFWALTNSFQSFSDSFVQIANTLTTDDGVGAQAPLYVFKWTFTCPPPPPEHPLCSFSVPYGWGYARDETTYTDVINDKWSAPDGRSYIDSTLYDDSQAMDMTRAGQIALFLLREFYAKDVTVPQGGDVRQSDGSERLTWRSASGGYEGESFFEARGTTFLMWTWVVSSDFFDVYTSLWGDIVASYKIP